MAILNGTDLFLKVGTTAGVGTLIVAHATSCSLDVSMDERDLTTKNSGGWKEIGGGLKSWSLSTDALYDPSAGANNEFNELFTHLDGRTELFVEFTRTTESSGEFIYTGKAYITSLSLSGGVEDSATYSISLAGTGVLTKEIIA
tara:strand:+ start:4381 stop:4812 length:432 start_codon:yes stop_codon:yes gene_type:complete